MEQPIRERDQTQQQQQLTQEGYLIGGEVLLETGPPTDYPEEPPPAYNELYPQMSTNLSGETYPQSSLTHTNDFFIPPMTSTNQSEDGNSFPSTSMNHSADSEILLAQSSTDRLNEESATIRDQDCSLETSEMLSSHQQQQSNVATSDGNERQQSLTRSRTTS